MKKLIKFLFSLLPQHARYYLYRKLVSIPNVLPENLIFKIAESRLELEGAFRLLHDCYVEVGLMKPHSSGLRVTPYHALSSSTTLIAKINEEVVATMTIIRDSPLGLPCDAFVDLNHLRGGGDRIAEISALAIKRGYRGLLLIHLMKFMYETCVNYLGINHLIATLTTDSKSQELYEAVLFFQPIESKVETNYAFSNFRPVIAEHLNLDLAPELFKKHYSGSPASGNLMSFFTEKKAEHNLFPDRHYMMIDYPVMTPSNFSYFFIEKTKALNDMSAKQLLAVLFIFAGQPQEANLLEVLKNKNIYPHQVPTARNRFNVSFATLAKGKSSLLPIRILDVSRFGLRISCASPIDDIIEIILPDGHGADVRLSARKAWQNGSGIYGMSIDQSASPNWNQMIEFFEGRQSSLGVSDIKKRTRKY